MSYSEELNDVVLSRIEECNELEVSLSDPSIFGDKKRLSECSKKYAKLRKIKAKYEEATEIDSSIKDLEEMLANETDPDLISMSKDEIQDLKNKLNIKWDDIKEDIIGENEDDSAIVLVEIKAGTGGDEAGLFCKDMARMYSLFGDKVGLTVEVTDKSENDAGGYKECTLRISGNNSYKYMKNEGGGHRVQRIPETESQGRVHTSMITVAVIVEPEEEEVNINMADLTFESCRSGGAGGQHVNTTDSAVRATHIPSGIVVRCEDQRSQHANKERAIKIIYAKLKHQQEEEKRAKESQIRSEQAGSGDRSERIRTYNFPQNRMTDHRINKSWHNLDMIVEGDLLNVVSTVSSQLREDISRFK